MRTIEVYTKGDCVFCTRAKTLLVREGISFKEINIDKPENSLALTQFLDMTTNKSEPVTVPYIRINNKYIGGYTELQQMWVNGEL